jgi:hypothetical protein
MCPVCRRVYAPERTQEHCTVGPPQFTVVNARGSPPCAIDGVQYRELILNLYYPADSDSSQIIRRNTER